MVNLNKFEGNIIKRARELGEVKNSPVIQNILVKLNEIKQYEVNNTFDPNYDKTLNMMIKKYNDLIDLKVDNYLIPLAEQVRYGKERNPILNQIKYIKKLKIKPSQNKEPILEQKTKVLKFGDIRGNMPERKMKGRYDLRSYKPAADDIYTHIIEYYWKHAYEFMDPQERPTQDELINISKLLYQLTKKYYVVQSRASNGNVKGADELLWDIIDRITNDQYKIIMKIAYHDGINKNHKLLYQACNIHKKKLEDDYNEEVKKTNAYREERKNMTPEAKQKEKDFFNKLSRNELIM
jgi:hypothetical protein